MIFGGGLGGRMFGGGGGGGRFSRSNLSLGDVSSVFSAELDASFKTGEVPPFTEERVGVTLLTTEPDEGGTD